MESVRLPSVLSLVRSYPHVTSIELYVGRELYYRSLSGRNSSLYPCDSLTFILKTVSIPSDLYGMLVSPFAA